MRDVSNLIPGSAAFQILENKMPSFRKLSLAERLAKLHAASKNLEIDVFVTLPQCVLVLNLKDYHYADVLQKGEFGSEHRAVEIVPVTKGLDYGISQTLMRLLNDSKCTLETIATIEKRWPEYIYFKNGLLTSFGNVGVHELMPQKNKNLYFSMDVAHHGKRYSPFKILRGKEYMHDPLSVITNNRWYMQYTIVMTFPDILLFDKESLRQYFTSHQSLNASCEKASKKETSQEQRNKILQGLVDAGEITSNMIKTQAWELLEKTAPNIFLKSGETLSIETRREFFKKQKVITFDSGVRSTPE